MNDLRIGVLPPTESAAIDINQINMASTGVFTCAEQPVTVYMRDVRKKMKVLVQHTQQLPKFHLTDCITVATDQRKPERYQRYAGSTRTDSLFPLYTLTNDGEMAEVMMKLSVCRSCLSKLDYQGYDHCDKATQNQIVADFSIAAFFAQQQAPAPIVTVTAATDLPVPSITVDTAVALSQVVPTTEEIAAPVIIVAETKTTATVVTHASEPPPAANPSTSVKAALAKPFTVFTLVRHLKPIEVLLTHFYTVQLLLKQAKKGVLGHVF